jgi:uncharacterized membrane protein
VDISMIVFRVIHIFAAVFMAGFALFMLIFVEPAITAMGTETQAFMRGFYKSAKRYETTLAILALLTLVSGIALFYRVSDHFNSDWLASTPGVVLIISSAMVIVSYAHGGMVTGQLSQKTANLMEEIGLQDNPLSEEQHVLMREIQAKHRLHGWIDSGLMVVAGVLMVAARYL